MSNIGPSVAAAAHGDKYDRLLARFAVSGFPPLIIAIGLDDQLLYALDRHNASTKVLALEPIASPAQKGMLRPTWRAWMAAGRLAVLVGPKYIGFADAWRMVGRDAPQPPMLVDPDLLQKFPMETEGAKAVAKQIVRGAHANEEARKRFAGGYLLHTLANLPTIVSEGDADVLSGLFNDVPAIVVGAGPSLDQNLAALSALRDRALIIAVDTAVRPLLAAGIRPHLVVSVDPSDANARHLNDLPDVRGLWFVAEGALAPSVFPQFAGRTFTFKVSNHDPWPWLAAHHCDRAKLQTWGSVLTTAFDVALRAGCDPVVFAGADLAYTEGLQYCRNTVYEPDWSPFPTNEQRAAEFAKYLQTRPHVTHQDLNGREVTTAPHFVQFRDWIVAQAQTAAPRRIVNSTGAGILHGAGVEQQDLGRLDFPVAPDDLRARLMAAWFASTGTSTKVREEIEQACAYGVSIPLDQWQSFGRDTTTVDQIRQTLMVAATRLQFDRRTHDYLARQRDSYDRRIETLDDAQELSHGTYAVAGRKAVSQQTHVLLDVLQRTYDPAGCTLPDVLRAMSNKASTIRALDVGCGVGRSMAPLVDAGINVDGVDISERMLTFARANARLANSSFFLSRGNDCGDAPDESYDLVYSMLCFRYIRSRSVRQELLRTMARTLKSHGVVVVEMRFFRGYTAGTIPAPHVRWSAEEGDPSVEAGSADVCPTLDELPLVYEDFARHFEDIRLQFVEVPQPSRDRLPVQLFVSGSVRGDLVSRIHALPPDSEPHS
jgi:SAM-dependent methyltransferase